MFALSPIFVGGIKFTERMLWCMNEKKITDAEFEKLISRLTFFDTMRNNLLTFSFTAVLAVLGVAIGTDSNSFSAWICLIPFFLIIPFSARISYYRLSTAHIGSFLKVYASEKMCFERGAEKVKEEQHSCFKVILWLVNHEMVSLALATDATFYFKYSKQASTLKIAGLAVPILFTLIVYLISDSTYDFSRLSETFRNEWKENIL